MCAGLATSEFGNPLAVNKKFPIGLEQIYLVVRDPSAFTGGAGSGARQMDPAVGDSWEQVMLDVAVEAVEEAGKEPRAATDVSRRRGLAQHGGGMSALDILHRADMVDDEDGCEVDAGQPDDQDVVQQRRWRAQG